MKKSHWLTIVRYIAFSGVLSPPLVSAALEGESLKRLPLEDTHSIERDEASELPWATNGTEQEEKLIFAFDLYFIVVY